MSVWTDDMPPRISRIIRETAAQHGVGIHEILSPTKTRRVTDARWAAMRAVRELPWPPSHSCNPPHPSLPLIGYWFGRDHTSVLHALRGGRKRGRA